MTHSDADLAGRVLAGSESAALELVRRYQRPVFNLIVRMVRDAALADDLAQETFVKAFARLATYDPRFKFANWIFKIAHNATIDHLRRFQPVMASLDDDDGSPQVRADTPSPLEVAEGHELAEALNSAIDHLRPEYREVVVLRFQEELSYEEIGEVLDLPIGTVKSYLHRARADLVSAMRSTGWDVPCNTRRDVSVGSRGRS